ncbi:MAG: cysteine desulfurase [Elusimicrobia bacterium]|nr:cysteine desulfurase [Elusimicrobiota bacterium]
MTYLDHNATTPIRPEALDAMLPWLRDGFGNPSSVYALGQRARAAVEAARAQAAALVGAADPSEIVFTSGGSESDVLAISGAAWRLRDETQGRRKRVVTTRIEHDAVRLLGGQLRRRGFEIAEAGCGSDGVVRAEELEALVDDATAVVSVMLANNETGALQPVARSAAAARAKGALAHTDAVQAAGKAPVDVRALGVDLLSLSGHKIGAPKGVGALYVRRGVRLDAGITGHQEKNRRGGTENVASIVGFGAACELARRELGSAAAHALSLRRRLEAGVLRLAGARLNGPAEGRLPNTSHFSFEGLDGRHLVVALDLEGICVSSGPACSSGASAPSHVLTAMGVAPELATGSIRVSFGWGTTEADIGRLLAVLPGAVARLREAGVSA